MWKAGTAVFCSEKVGVACLWWGSSYLWKAGKAGLCSEVGVVTAYGWCGWSYLWQGGKAGLCFEVGLICLWWVWLVLPLEGRQGWTLF
jgi:hypothetical protein